MRKLILLSVALPAMAAAQSNYRSEVWSPDNGDGTYTNPVINADYSDPDVCVGPSGEDYYMTASSFQCTPGLPILHSTDLVNWQIIGYALKSLYTGDADLERHFSTPQHGAGVWAPSIRYHNGEYYIYWGDPDFGVYMVKASDPAGEWSKPLCVIPGQGYIDTTPLWDDDGRCYLVNGWANSRAKFASVLTVRELSSDGTKAIGQPVIVFDGNGTDNRTCEGPKFYKHDGWYWIMCPAGGVPTGFQLAMRAKSPYGPYEHKIVLQQGKTAVNGPHQGGWVHTKYGEDWFLHFQDKEAYGRVVHLNPVDWSSGWPVMGRKGEPVATYRKPAASTDHPSPVVNPVESDEFNDPVIGKQWQWHANYDEKFGVPTAFGTFRIYTYKLSEGWKNFWEVPNLLLQKTPADEFTVTAKLRMTSKAEGQFGGLIMMGLDYSALVVRRTGQAFQLVQMTCKAADKGKPQTEEVIATLKPTAADKIDYKPGIHEDIYLRLRVKDSKVRFAWSANGKKFADCGQEFQMKEGKWIGAKFGFVAAETDAKCDRGWVDADWIRVTKYE